MDLPKNSAPRRIACANSFVGAQHAAPQGPELITAARLSCVPALVENGAWIFFVLTVHCKLSAVNCGISLENCTS